MAAGRTNLTTSVEDYLKAVYALSQGGSAATTSSLARVLEVQPASVTGMIKRLAENGLLEHLPYKGVLLTEAGLGEALRVIRRHRILETYLQLRLDFSWDDVHGEAERLEHAASDALIDRMATALGEPTHDPHGAPIPSRTGEIEAPVFATLADALPGSTVQVRAVQDEDSDHLRRLETLGLTPGVQVNVVSREHADGPLTLTIDSPDNDGIDRTIEYDLAQSVYVAPSTGQDRI
jgi:DtxR family transcriptional regulator, Mn-dependent transcriptional regulator